MPGTYTWGEAVSAQTGGLELGDMPHSWAAAEFICLIRDMLLMWDEGRLIVNAGGPDAWLQPDRSVALQNAPTHYGIATVSLTRGAPLGVVRPT